MRPLVVALLMCALPGIGWAQQPDALFEGRVMAAAERGALPRAVADQVVVGIRIDRLFDTPAGVAARIVLNVGTRSWVARLERIDRDNAGFRSWVGAIEGIANSHVVLTERDGVVSGLINAVDVTYQIRTQVRNTYLLERVDTAALGDELEPVPGADGRAPATAPLSQAAAADDASAIDVLMLYTPKAREQRGGTAQIEALISQVISDTNTAFARSGVGTRVRLVASAEFGLTEAPQMTSDLVALKSAPAARAGRDSVGADLVQLLVSSPDLAYCGAGYLLGSTSSTNFDAYSVADVSCAAQYTPSHEMAHNMGSHHAREDGASGGLFEYSYGFKDPARGFRTIMAYACAGSAECPRVLNFSNPIVAHNGGATGSALADNARSINDAAWLVANFRQSVSPVPAAPVGLVSHVAGNAVNLAWNGVADAASYHLEVGTARGSADLFNASVGNTTAVSGVVGEGSYFWRVYAQNAAGRGAASAEAQFTVSACTAPGAPQHFTFSISNRVVTLAWSPPATGTIPATYIVEAGSASGLSDLFNAETGPGLGLVIAAPPGAYYVRVRARSVCGTSAPSSEQRIAVQ